MPVKTALQQIGGLAKHIGKQVIRQPLEIVKDSLLPANLEKGQALPTSQSQPQQPTTSSSSTTPSPLQRYQQLAQQRDAIQLKQLRARLHQQYGLPTSLEAGMTQARQQRQQQETQRQQVEQQQRQQQKLLEQEKKKHQSIQITRLKQRASVEKGLVRKIT